MIWYLFFSWVLIIILCQQQNINKQNTNPFAISFQKYKMNQNNANNVANPLRNYLISIGTLKNDIHSQEITFVSIKIVVNHLRGDLISRGIWSVIQILRITNALSV